MSGNKIPNFALVGAAGYIAPRHMEAIKSVGGYLKLATDVCDSVGVLDKYDTGTVFVNGDQTFEALLMAKKKSGKKLIDYLVVCVPNWLHYHYISIGLTAGIDVICEKPVVTNVAAISWIKEKEKRSGKKVYPVLQLRLHREVLRLKDDVFRIRRDVLGSSRPVKGRLVYIVQRGQWYHESWKGKKEESGGLAMNIGVHFFDMLIWVFGKPISNKFSKAKKHSITGVMVWNDVEIEWVLAVEKSGHQRRMLTLGKETYDFTRGFENLHIEMYKRILSKTWYGIDSCKEAIDICNKMA